MNKIGKLVNTHGIKGEVRVFLTSFDMFEQLNKVKEIYVGKEKLTLKSFRNHKNFTLMTFEEYNNINDVLHLKGQSVYLDEEEKEVFLQQSLEGYSVLNEEGEFIGKIKEVFFNNAHGVADLGDKMLPLVEEYIIMIDEDKKEIKTDYFNEVADED